MFEALIATSSKKLSSPDPLNYVLAVARQLWKTELQATLTKDADELRLERGKRRISEENAELADVITSKIELDDFERDVVFTKTKSGIKLQLYKE